MADTGERQKSLKMRRSRIWETRVMEIHSVEAYWNHQEFGRINVNKREGMSQVLNLEELSWCSPNVWMAATKRQAGRQDLFVSASMELGILTLYTTPGQSHSSYHLNYQFYINGSKNTSPVLFRPLNPRLRTIRLNDIFTDSPTSSQIKYIQS